MFDVHFLVNPSYETSQGQSFFFDLTGHPPEAGKLRRPAAGLTPETCLPAVAWKAKEGHLKPSILTK
jgi:hypothetical protein